MIFAAFRRSAVPATQPAPAPVQPDTSKLVSQVSQRSSHLGREAAEVRGVLDDTQKLASAQAAAVQALAEQLNEVVLAQTGIADEVDRGLASVAQVGDAVSQVGTEVGGIVETLREVSDAAQQITQIALQTRLVAFNASVEAKRAGDAGRGFGVVADAVKDLAAKVESSSKAIMGTVAQLGQRVDLLSREVSRDASADSGVHRALVAVQQGVGRIKLASDGSREVCGELERRMAVIEGEMRRTTGALDGALQRTEVFLRVSEQLIEALAECGVETEDTIFIRGAQQAAGQIAQLLEDALRTGAISVQDLFDDKYQPLPGSNPVQLGTRFAALADQLFPQVQERMLELSEKVVYCIAVDRNGYVACHNQIYNQPQRRDAPVWNTAHCRNRRVFNDRTGLAAARNQRPFLLQTYRRDMGGGQFVVMKEAAAPIQVSGRHWGGLRVAFKF